MCIRQRVNLEIRYRDLYLQSLATLRDAVHVPGLVVDGNFGSEGVEMFGYPRCEAYGIVLIGMLAPYSDRDIGVRARIIASLNM